jgi:spermidine synthase
MGMAVRFAFETPLAAILFRAHRTTGEWVLRRRTPAGGSPRLELILNGRLLMDSADGTSEEALAEIGLRRCAGAGTLRVLVGGLGFGFTLRAVLRDARVAAVDVVELEPALGELLAAPGIAGDLGPPGLRDPRVRLEVGDVRERIARAEGAWDCILLDVDNGPESLSAVGNEGLYTEAGLRACRRALRPGGSLAIWSSEPAPACRARLAAVLGGAEERLVPVVRDGRALEYRILSARRRGRAAGAGGGPGATSEARTRPSRTAPLPAGR